MRKKTGANMKHGFTSRLESTEKDNNQNTQ